MDEGIFFSLRLSVQVASFATVLVVVIGIPCAYLIARRDFRGREALDMAFTLPLVLPPSVIGYYLIVLFGRSGVVGSHLYAWTGWTIMFTSSRRSPAPARHPKWSRKSIAAHRSG